MKAFDHFGVMIDMSRNAVMSITSASPLLATPNLIYHGNVAAWG